MFVFDYVCINVAEGSKGSATPARQVSIASLSVLQEAKITHVAIY